MLYIHIYIYIAFVSSGLILVVLYRFGCPAQVHLTFPPFSRPQKPLLRVGGNSPPGEQVEKKFKHHRFVGNSSTGEFPVPGLRQFVAREISVPGSGGNTPSVAVVPSAFLRLCPAVAAVCPKFSASAHPLHRNLYDMVASYPPALHNARDIPWTRSSFRWP